MSPCIAKVRKTLNNRQWENSILYEIPTFLYEMCGFYYEQDRSPSIFAYAIGHPQGMPYYLIYTF